LAVVALTGTGLLIVLALGLFVNNFWYAIVGIVGLAIAVAAAWPALTKTGVHRAWSALAMVAGMGLLVVAVIGASDSAWLSAIRLAAFGILFTLTTTAARAAMIHSNKADVAAQFHKVTPPARPVLICNPWSGDGKVVKFGLPDLASSMGVETILLDRGLDLEQLARDAVARGADCLGMAGGDGSQALVASIAVEHNLPFVCIPAGTRNHFALDLGLHRDDPGLDLVAFRDGIERTIDFASVNGRLFVNNASLGVYATVVQQAGYRQAKAETTTRLLPDLLGKTDEPFDLQFTSPEGLEVIGPLIVQVSNNPYVTRASTDLAQRRRLDTGMLGVVAAEASGGADAAHVVAGFLTGHPGEGAKLLSFTCKGFQVRSQSGTAYVGIDGEALRLPTPLDFQIHPRGLKLLVPKDNRGRAVRRRARDTNLRDLLSLAVHPQHPMGNTTPPLLEGA
jgi:diacylglycerol kinase family enzyme